jgi:hypothetical protein
MRIEERLMVNLLLPGSRVSGASGLGSTTAIKPDNGFAVIPVQKTAPFSKC